MQHPSTESFPPGRREQVRNEVTMRLDITSDYTYDDVTASMLEPTQPVESYTWAVHAGLWGILKPLDGVSPVIQLKSMTYHIGRLRRRPSAAEGHVVIDNPTVSRSHCVIRWNGRDDFSYEVEVEDYGSSNGTFINNEMLPSDIQSRNFRRVGSLRHGDIICFGETSPPQNGYKDTRFRYVHIAQSMNVL